MLVGSISIQKRCLSSGTLNGPPRYLFGHRCLRAGLIKSMVTSIRIMTAAGMWGKAGILFAEMGLERDLDELERVRLEM